MSTSSSIASIASTTTSVNLGPLTTTFDPTWSECSSTYMIEAIAETETYSWDQIGPLGSYCQPSGYDVAILNYYSPGGCPVSSTFACQTTIEEGITEATCCPTGYSCQRLTNGNVLRCVTTLANDQLLTMMYNKMDSDGRVLIATTSVAYLKARDEIYAYGIVVRDPTSIPSETATTTVATALNTSSVAGSINNSSEIQHEPASLSSGAVAGIAVGAVLGFLFLIGIALGICLHRRRVKRRHNEMQAEAAHSPISECGSKSAALLELEDRRGAGKLHAGDSPSELIVWEKPVELSG